MLFIIQHGREPARAENQMVCSVDLEIAGGNIPSSIPSMFLLAASGPPNHAGYKEAGRQEATES